MCRLHSSQDWTRDTDKCRCSNDGKQRDDQRRCLRFHLESSILKADFAYPDSTCATFELLDFCVTPE